MLRAYLSGLLVAILTLAFSLPAIGLGALSRTGDIVMTLARAWARLVLAGAGIRVAVKRDPAWNPRQTYVYVANHTSTVDIWAALAAIPRPIRFIAKKQLARIPFLGWAMSAGRFIFIDCSNPAAARRSIDRAAERIRAGSSVLIFPEGTRSRDGRLGAFKKGGFHLAITSGVPIVPIGIKGAMETMPRGSLFPRAGHVSVELGAPMPTAGLAAGERDRFTQSVRERIIAMTGQQPVEASSPADAASAPAVTA